MKGHLTDGLAPLSQHDDSNERVSEFEVEVVDPEKEVDEKTILFDAFLCDKINILKTNLLSYSMIFLYHTLSIETYHTLKFA